MSQIPANLKYSKTHEWVKQEADGSVTIGITDHAQQLLGDMVFVDLPQLNKAVKLGDEIGVVESVKAASDIYSPLSGTIIAINENLNTQPELVNQEPYQQGWLCKLKLSDTDELAQLLDATNYQQQVDSEH